MVNAQNINNKVSSALNFISTGSVEHGVNELVKLSRANDLAAQFFLGVCYENGICVQKNINEAFSLYRRSAERGLPDAMYKLALFYQNGMVVAQNSSKSSEWMRRFERRGGRNVLPDIIELYNEGLKCPDNYSLNPVSGVAKGNNNVEVAVNDVKVNKIPTSIQVEPVVQQEQRRPSADVDITIPELSKDNGNTFAVIIANENYEEESDVEFALNDGEIFKAYCHKVLGLPETNVHYRGDATLNNILAELDWMKQISSAFGGDAKFIFYYAGHGIPDEATGDSYLLPVDGRGNMLATGYSLKRLYEALGGLNAKNVTVFMDACFSGAVRSGGMMASARGVAIKAKPAAPKGSMVVLSAAQGDETAYPYKEKGHGLFTYHLLKKLQETKGNVTMGELADYITSEVKKRSIVVNGKLQTPTVTHSSNAADWRNWKLR